MECPFCQRQIAAYSKQCKQCGRAIPLGQYLLEESGIVEPTSSASLGGPAKRAPGTQEQYRYARLGDRFIAFVLDTAFLFGLFALVDSWAFMRWGSVEGNELRLTTASLLIAITMNAALLFLYGFLLEVAWGATLGKAMVGIKVAGAGRPRSMSNWALRNVLRVIGGLGFYQVGTAVAACSAARQRVGDIYGRTVVIEESFASSIRVAVVVLWIASLAGAGWAIPRICSVNRFAPPPYLSQVLIRVGRNESLAYLTVGSLSLNVQFASNPPDHSALASAESTRSQ